MNRRFEIVISGGHSTRRLPAPPTVGRLARIKIFLVGLLSVAITTGFLIALLIVGSAIAAIILSVLVILVALWFLRAAFRRARG